MFGMVFAAFVFVPHDGGIVLACFWYRFGMIWVWYCYGVCIMLVLSSWYDVGIVLEVFFRIIFA